MLLSKALRMQHDFEDKKNEIIIEGLENKIKDFEASLEKKDFLLQAAEGSLAEAQAENTKLSEELCNVQTTLKKESERFEQERKELQAKTKVVSHPALRNKARCISYMRQEDNIYNNRVYRDKCHKTSEYLLHSGSLITK
jgi:predicted  nucleic acid-binding Zn-ribbon protein